jgi:hypothetical protein
MIRIKLADGLSAKVLKNTKGNIEVFFYLEGQFIFATMLSASESRGLTTPQLLEVCWMKGMSEDNIF